MFRVVSGSCDENSRWAIHSSHQLFAWFCELWVMFGFKKSFYDKFIVVGVAFCVIVFVFWALVKDLLEDVFLGFASVNQIFKVLVV